ncbi:hypothetical protein Hpkin58_12940 [Helicobacter pylori]
MDAPKRFPIRLCVMGDFKSRSVKIFRVKPNKRRDPNVFIFVNEVEIVHAVVGFLLVIDRGVKIPNVLLIG